MSLEVSQLSRHFDGVRPAVDGTSFSAASGAITTLLGPSGSGKTTVLRIIAGLEQADGGTVSLDGVDFTRLPVRRRGVGLVFQNYALFRHMRVRDNIAFGLRAKRLSRAAVSDRVKELLALVQLEELGDRYPAELSGGQQQRVAFARALAPEPKLLLLDEPFGALDAHVRVELRRWLCTLHERTQVTTLLVTHDQEEALDISQQIVVMNRGRVEQAGSPNEIYDHPATPFVASFVGSATRLGGHVSGGRARVGGFSFAAPKGAEDGAPVYAFVRPHHIRIRRPPAALEKVQLAAVERLQRVGALVRVDVRLLSGDSMGVELTPTEAESLELAMGDTVLVDFEQAAVFVADCAG